MPNPKPYKRSRRFTKNNGIDGRIRRNGRKKQRKMVIIHVDSCEIRLKVLRDSGFGASW